MNETQNAALDLVMELEAMAPANAGFLHAGRGADPNTGKQILGLKDSSGHWLIAFADDVTLDQAAYIARLYNNAHTLISLSLLGLEAAGVAPGCDIGKCRACGSTLVELTTRATPRGEVHEVLCLDCNQRMPHILPALTARQEKELV